MKQEKLFHITPEKVYPGIPWYTLHEVSDETTCMKDTNPTSSASSC